MSVIHLSKKKPWSELRWVHKNVWPNRSQNWDDFESNLQQSEKFGKNYFLEGKNNREENYFSSLLSYIQYYLPEKEAVRGGR